MRDRRSRRAQANQSRARADAYGDPRRGDGVMSMRNAHEDVLDDLAALVAGDPDALARHGEHLAGCDDCRDARHEASKLAGVIGAAGGDYVAEPGLADKLLAKLDAAAAPAAS